jgi:hypothetical protein
MKRYQGIETEYKDWEGQQWKVMKTSQDQQGQQEYVDDVTDGRSVVPKSAPMGRSIPAVVGCAAKKRCFESIGYYSISL